ncbi:hypothetical protein BDZ91DRAFT_522695 [Kalaharituber pfeilii]|nr:hypothetical protein BDZ91DRAFT_522695 [Kalaharituber pfeilii]
MTAILGDFGMAVGVGKKVQGRVWYGCDGCGWFATVGAFQGGGDGVIGGIGGFLSGLIHPTKKQNWIQHPTWQILGAKYLLSHLAYYGGWRCGFCIIVLFVPPTIHHHARLQNHLQARRMRYRRSHRLQCG